VMYQHNGRFHRQAGLYSLLDVDSQSDVQGWSLGDFVVLGLASSDSAVCYDRSDATRLNLVNS